MTAPSDDAPGEETAAERTLERVAALDDYLGGFATVWEGFDTLLRRPVAVKVRRPEALLSETIRRDVHGLGLILDRLLNGRTLRSGGTTAEIYRQVLVDEPRPADRVTRAVTRDLAAVCLKCLAKRPVERYPTAAAELRRGFEVLQSGNVAQALDKLADTRTIDPALADSLAGRWLLRRTHGERQMLLGPPASTAAKGGAPRDLYAIALSPDATSAAVAAADGTVRLVRGLDGTPEIRSCAAHDEVNDVAFSPDGGLLATVGQEGRLRWWSVTDAGLVAAGDTSPGASPLYAAAFAPDGRAIAVGGEDRAVRLVRLDAADQPVELFRFAPPPGRTPDVESIVFVDDRTLAASCGELIVLLDGPRRRLAVSWLEDRPVVVIDLDASEPAASQAVPFPQPADPRQALTRWTPAGAPRGALVPHERSMVGVAFSRDGRILVSASEDAVRISDAAGRSRAVGSRRGLTLVELLVVVAIVGLLAALLLPAVQTVREAGRRTQCHANLRQLALACLAHEQSRGFLPSGGWGMQWVGDPDRGFGQRQPGGWAFNILPHLEAAGLHDLGTGLTDADAKADVVALRLATPLAVFTCPTRRPAATWPLATSKAALLMVAVPTTVSRRPATVVRGDYAANMGTGDMPNRYLSGGAPSSVVPGDMMTEAMWQSGFGPAPNGVVFRRSRIRLRDIPDGISATYLLGEKYLEPGSIATGLSDDDDQCLYSGHDRDVLRTGLEPPSHDRARFDPVTVSGVPGSTNRFPLPIAFGSAHPEACGMAMVDGSVRPVSYAIDPAAHRAAAGRNDGQTAR